MSEDIYKIITEVLEGTYIEKCSKSIAITLLVCTLEEIKNHLEMYQKKYYDTHHVCYAYVLRHERKNFRANDNGEPSGTAGKPILGRINSNEPTDILITAVRYFGGIKLGISGLIAAYKAAAVEAIAAVTVVEKTVDEEVTVLFEYPLMNNVMRIVKEEEPEILSQSYDMDCSMALHIRQSAIPRLRYRLEKVETACILDEEEGNEQEKEIRQGGGFLPTHNKEIDRMVFGATKREWSKLYVFFRLLAGGKVSLGTP